MCIQEGGRPLHFAAHLGHTDVVEVLLEQYGADATLASDVSVSVRWAQYTVLKK